MFLFCLLFAMSLYASVSMCFVVTCWERADLLDLVCGVYCEYPYLICHIQPLMTPGVFCDRSKLFAV